MIKNTFLGLGPMSIEVINSLDSFSKKYKKKIMLICSRNQIEAASLGGGYVNNFSTQQFGNFIKRKKNKFLIMSRDHCGPFKRDDIKNSISQEIENCKTSLYQDIINDFKILHIDTSECGKAKYEVADELMSFCNQTSKDLNKEIHFEFGCEDHGVLTNFTNFERDAKFFSKYKNKQFIVCQTGSLIKSIFQVGQFDVDSVHIMKKIANNYGILLKEHNCDYLNIDQIKLRKDNGINAINIAPELGVMQTHLLYYLSKKNKLDKEISKFKKYVLKNGKWKKWNYNNENDLIKFFSSGHYYYGTEIYKDLILKLNKKIKFQKILNKSIEDYLIRFF